MAQRFAQVAPASDRITASDMSNRPVGFLLGGFLRFAITFDLYFLSGDTDCLFSMLHIIVRFSGPKVNSRHDEP